MRWFSELPCEVGWRLKFQRLIVPAQPRPLVTPMASTMTYLCRHFPKRSAVVLVSPAVTFALSAKIGVPVKPNIWALVKNFRIFWWVSPNWLRWHSSKMKTTLLSFRCPIFPR